MVAVPAAPNNAPVHATPMINVPPAPMAKPLVSQVFVPTPTATAPRRVSTAASVVCVRAGKPRV